MDHVTDNIAQAEPNPAITNSLNLIAILVGVSFFFLQSPYTELGRYSLFVFILAAIPPITGLLWFRSDGLYEMTAGWKNSLLMAFGAPGAALTVRALTFRLLNFTPLVVCAVIAGLALTWPMARQDKKTRTLPEFIPRDQRIDMHQVFIVTVLFCTISYVFGVTAQANGIFDTSVRVFPHGEGAALPTTCGWHHGVLAQWK